MGGPGAAGSGARPVDGVLFDIDDTLVDTRGAFARALAGTTSAYLPHLPAARGGDVLAHWRADSLGYYRQYTAGELGYEAQRMARANDLQAEFGGAALDLDSFHAWDAVFEEGVQSAWAAHSDALQVIAELRADGVAVGALSNALVGYQTRKLARAGLAGAMPMLVGLDTLGFGKPDPRVFLEACRLLGTEPARTAYVGDELDIDAQAASAAGLIGVWLDRPGARRVEISADDVAAAGVIVLPGLAGLRAALGF
ncbi:HAD family hydrolase [Pengzhenrongella sicca]|uniref:HAD family hydrolase n=1 Tax=Pengzhenrongella sicca TaxID=2819238 RepID=A0A8A4ZG77_9MICO|nr:HAD family hydrolase [Pengzhenrongella sicca]QTE28668.1 HAD family hydrolase [Pengzhenrongella sicca]